MKSLQHANREILKENKISVILDDFIYMQIRMKDGIKEKPKLGETSSVNTHTTPVQISLVKSLNVKDALLIVKDEKAKSKYQTIIIELALGPQFSIATLEEVYGSKMGTRKKQEKLQGREEKLVEKIDMKQFDVVMIDDTLKVKKQSKRNTPFPVKLKQNSINLKACL